MVMPLKGESMRPATFASRDLITIPIEATVADALILMRGREIHHLLAMRGNDVRGVISDRDILEKAFDQETMKISTSLRVIDVMTSQVPVLDQDTNIGSALAALRQYKVSALPIRVNNQLGIVTETDFLDMLAATHRAGLDRDVAVPVEVALANPLMQKVMQMLADIGI